MRALASAHLVAASLLAVGCGGPKPPMGWAQGGARLELPQARWVQGDEPVEVRPRGTWAEVTVDGDLELILDMAGRVYDAKKSPIAMLEPDGRLVGTDDELLGQVGSVHAAPPGQANAWVSVAPQGQVVRYVQGRPVSAGQWYGCGWSATANQACVLITHVLLLRASDRSSSRGAGPMGPTMGPTMGPGVGVGVGVGVSP